jgi:ATP-binding cassette subfamily F protein uup
LIVVSHDREFLDNVVTSTIVFEEDGRIKEYVGGYSDWMRRGRQLAITDNPYEAEARKREAVERRKARPPTKLSYKDQRELDTLPAEIGGLEELIASLQHFIAEPGFYAQDKDTVQAKLRELADAEALLEQRVERWGELESLAQSFRV